MAKKELQPLPKPRSLVQLLFQIEYILFHVPIKLSPMESFYFAASTLAMIDVHVAIGSRIESATASTRRRVIDYVARFAVFILTYEPPSDSDAKIRELKVFQ